MKNVSFRGSSLSDLRDFPDTPRRAMGYQIENVQMGREPEDWKPMNTIGAGVNEIRVQDDSGAYRAFYVAKFGGTIYVLHCFKKTTPKTSQRDKDIGIKRYKELLKELGK